MNNTFRPGYQFTNGAKHGTQSGYVIHRKYGEQACKRCKAAHAQWAAGQRMRLAAQRGEKAST